MIKYLFIALFSISTILSCFSQDSIPENDKTATVYFVRPSSYAAHAMFYILDEDSLININEGINWFKYEGKPGEHLFWVTNRKNTDFLPADLIAGETYIAIIYLYPGFGKTSLQLLPLKEESKYYSRAKELILNEEESKTTHEDLFYKMKSLNKRGVIKESLNHYEKEWRFERNYEFLEDSCISSDPDLRIK